MHGRFTTTVRFSGPNTASFVVDSNFRVIVACTIPRGKPLSSKNLRNLSNSPSSLLFEIDYGKRIVAAVSRCYTSVKLTPIFTSRTVPIRPVKDVVPTLALSNVIYFYECHCGSGYVGKTTQILLKRIEGHVPPIFRSTSGRKCKIPARHSSAIGQHLVENPECARKYNDAKFSILARGRSDYHLAVLEAIFILARRPILCRQKKFVLALKLFQSC